MYVHIHWVDVTGGLVICSNLKKYGQHGEQCSV